MPNIDNINANADKLNNQINDKVDNATDKFNDKADKVNAKLSKGKSAVLEKKKKIFASLIKNQLVIKGFNIIKVGVKFVRVKMKKLKEILKYVKLMKK